MLTVGGVMFSQLELSSTPPALIWLPLQIEECIRSQSLGAAGNQVPYYGFNLAAEISEMCKWGLKTSKNT